MRSSCNDNYNPLLIIINEGEGKPDEGGPTRELKIETILTEEEMAKYQPGYLMEGLIILRDPVNFCKLDFNSTEDGYIEVTNLSPSKSCAGYEGHSENVRIRKDGLGDLCGINKYPNKIISEINTAPVPIGGIYLNSDDSRLYAAYWEDDNNSRVQEYDLADNSIIQTIDFGSFHTHGDVVLSSSDQYLFTSNYYHSNISRIDLQNQNERDDLNVGSSWPGDIDISPDKSKIVVAVGRDGRSYDMNNDQITIVDINSFSILAEVILDDEPTGKKIGFSVDSKKAYIPTLKRKSSSNILYEISLEEPYDVLRSVPIGNSNGGVAVTDSKIFVSDNENGKILIFDLSTFTQTSSISIDGNPATLAITPNKKYLYSLNSNNSLSIIDLFDDTLIETVNGLNNGPHDIEFSKNSLKAYICYSNFEGGLLYYLNKGIFLCFKLQF